MLRMPELIGPLGELRKAECNYLSWNLSSLKKTAYSWKKMIVGTSIMKPIVQKHPERWADISC